MKAILKVFLWLVNGFFVFSFLSKEIANCFHDLIFCDYFQGRFQCSFTFSSKGLTGNSPHLGRMLTMFSISWIVPLVHVTFCLVANSVGISAERLLGVWYTYCKVLKAVQNTITMNDLTLDPWFMIFYDRNIAWMFYSCMLYMEYNGNKNVECTTHNTQELALLTMVPVQYWLTWYHISILIA